MTTESVWVRFRKFMTPGRTLIALTILFIGLPSAAVWTGVANFGPGRGAGGTGSDKTGSKEESKVSSDLEVASAKAKALMSSASGAGGTGGGSGSGGGAAAPEKEEKIKKDQQVQVGLPNLNPVQVKPPMAQPQAGSNPDASPVASPVASQPVQKPEMLTGVAPAASSQAKVQAQANSNDAPAATPLGPGVQPLTAQMAQSDAANKSRQAQPPSLEDKVRAALTSRLQGGGEITITYGGDVLERSSTAQGKGNATR